MTTDLDRRDRSALDRETFRPALVTLTRDLRGLQSELYAGFPRRRDLLDWLQRLAIRTLGEIPQRVYWEIARQFVLDVREDQRQGVLLAALLTGAARDRDLPPDAVDELRERLVASQIRPAYHRAFRQLRKDATEYIDDGDDGDSHDPQKQRHVAMRPALSELDSWQGTALATLLDGFEASREILEWGELLELATHGELNDVERPAWVPTSSRSSSTSEDLIQRAYREPSTRAVLLSSSSSARSSRELFAAFHVVPAFNRGVRTLSGRAGEVPDADKERQTPKSL